MQRVAHVVKLANNASYYFSCLVFGFASPSPKYQSFEQKKNNLGISQYNTFGMSDIGKKKSTNKPPFSLKRISASLQQAPLQLKMDKCLASA